MDLDEYDDQEEKMHPQVVERTLPETYVKALEELHLEWETHFKIQYIHKS